MAVQPKDSVDVSAKLPVKFAETEQFLPSPTDVLLDAVPEYDHTPLVSEAENERFAEWYVCSPGTGVLCAPATMVETESDVSPSTSAPETLGFTVNE